MQPSRYRALGSSLLWGLLLAAWAPEDAEAFRWPWSDAWPATSYNPVWPLEHPTVESRFAPTAAARVPAQATVPAGAPYRFAAFGDQRALADKEWPMLMERIALLDADDEKLAFLVDSGDIVDNGSHSDQFVMLRGILGPARHLPYLVCVGNHEVVNNRSAAGRENTARFLAYLDEDFSAERMYYRKDLGPATFLFLDTNDFTYGDEGFRKACPLQVDPSTREGAQLSWIRAQAADLGRDPAALVIAVMHHPLVQSSKKHSDAACALWNFSDDGQTLADLLADAGVDLVITGHTHTYERFRLRRDDGRELFLVNLSGRPRDSFLWIGAGDRRARDIRGEEEEWLRQLGWLGLERWEITQEDVMLKPDEADQFAVFTVEPGSGLLMQVHFLDEAAPGGTRRTPEVRLH